MEQPAFNDSMEKQARPDVSTLRKAIPAHCFRPNQACSLMYIVRDLTIAAFLVYLALNIQHIHFWFLRWSCWAVYGIAQGFVFTGIWILAHECGHGALFANPILSDAMGFPLHSILLVPYFSWKYSHARHHRYTNHMDKDTAFVPLRKGEFSVQTYLAHAFEMMEDAPVLNAALLVGHQLVGWPMYLMTAITSGNANQSTSNTGQFSINSHFDPRSALFTPSQRLNVLISDLGLLVMALGLWQLGQVLGNFTVVLLYFVPWLWVNHWIVAITFLHHTHPMALHYEESAWTYKKGALATVDRDFGSIGRHLFHGIIDYHVIHHLFPRIPFYHAEEATHCIEPMLGKLYLRQKTPFLEDLWNTFVHSRYVNSAADRPGELAWAS